MKEIGRNDDNKTLIMELSYEEAWWLQVLADAVSEQELDLWAHAGFPAFTETDLSTAFKHVKQWADARFKLTEFDKLLKEWKALLEGEAECTSDSS